jgi:hypothetical protein
MSRTNVPASIPSYEEAVTATPPRGPPPSQPTPAEQPPAPSTSIPPSLPTLASPSPELPPAYTSVDEKATTFTIYGTFIHTPSGPAYQLSSLLDSRIAKLRIRKLRAEEISRLQAGAPSVSFDPHSVIYEAHDPPFLVNEFYLQGKSTSTLPGFLQLRFGLRRWHVKHIPVQGAPPNEIMTCGKRGGWSKMVKQRRNEMEPSEWKDADGTVMATEVLRMGHGGKMPQIEMKEGLDSVCRELILALWCARLWAAFGAGGGGV